MKNKTLFISLKLIFLFQYNFGQVVHSPNLYLSGAFLNPAFAGNTQKNRFCMTRSIFFRETQNETNYNMDNFKQLNDDYILVSSNLSWDGNLKSKKLGMGINYSSLRTTEDNYRQLGLLWRNSEIIKHNRYFEIKNLGIDINKKIEFEINNGDTATIRLGLGISGSYIKDSLYQSYLKVTRTTSMNPAFYDTSSYGVFGQEKGIYLQKITTGLAYTTPKMYLGTSLQIINLNKGEHLWCTAIMGGYVFKRKNVTKAKFAFMPKFYLNLNILSYGTSHEMTTSKVSKNYPSPVGPKEGAVYDLVPIIYTERTFKGLAGSINFDFKYQKILFGVGFSDSYLGGSIGVDYYNFKMAFSLSHMNYFNNMPYTFENSVFASISTNVLF